MTRYQVDSEEVFSASAMARATGERIEAEVSAMLTQLTNLQSSWSGQAATAFQGVIADWRATQQHVAASLVGINTALGQAGQQYADIEQTNARLFGR